MGKKRNYRVTYNNKPIPCKPGQFNDCWDVRYDELDGYGNWIPTGFSMVSETYKFLEDHFSKKQDKKIQSLTEQRDKLAEKLREIYTSYHADNSCAVRDDLCSHVCWGCRELAEIKEILEE